MVERLPSMCNLESIPAPPKTSLTSPILLSNRCPLRLEQLSDIADIIQRHVQKLPEPPS